MLPNTGEQALKSLPIIGAVIIIIVIILFVYIKRKGSKNK
ncbi:LPXTG cell wall anchor domain-containing protein [Lactococcus piscium]|nr:LPXTG cell wall anchor domain-containing protein [Lactococcus carnosus]